MTLTGWHLDSHPYIEDVPVLGIHEIAFEVRDLEQSIAFYRDILGLPLYSRGPRQAWFRIGTQRLALFTYDRPGSGQHFALLIPPEKADQARDALIAHGFPKKRCNKTTVFPFMSAILMGTRSNCTPNVHRPNQSRNPFQHLTCHRCAA